MNLIFKRGDKNTLDNTPITPNMLFFTTDNNHSIYMDTENKERYKLFGLNDNDLISSIDEASVNTYYNMLNAYNVLLDKDSVATDGNIVNKKAIGVGYYNDVIGENIENILYKQYPTITSSITNLQTIARSALIPIWINDSLDTTWENDSYRGTISIPLSQTFLGYVVFIQPYIDDAISIYPITTFTLPQSINQFSYNYTRAVKSGKINVVDSYEDFINDNNIHRIDTTIALQLTSDNNLIINKYHYSDYENIELHKYSIPIAIYGWRL